MATNLSDSVAALARQIAVDQIAQDIDNEQKFAKKEDVAGSSELTARLLTLESKVTELIQKCWVQEVVEPLSLSVQPSGGQEDAFSVRLSALEAKVSELQTKTWKQEALNGNE